MRFIDEYQEINAITKILKEIEKEIDPNRHYRIMEFCGGHTHTFFKSGLIDLLPKQVELVHGPGCPVCVLPSSQIESIINLHRERKNLITCIYADLYKIPIREGNSLLKAKAAGSDIRYVYSPLDALEIAKKNSQAEVIFFAIGFETTTPPTLVALKKAIELKISNFSIFCNHIKTDPALEYILKEGQGIDGIIGPGHVAAITGAKLFEPYSKKYKRPIVISGFYPFDLAESILMLVRQINRGLFNTEIQYKRIVTYEGNKKAQSMMDRYLEEREAFTWKGLGVMSKSAYKLKEEFRKYDAEKIFYLKSAEGFEHKGCLCSQVLVGKKNPLDCKLYETVCTPQNPLGPCMVSSEGSCAAYFQAGKKLTLGEAKC